MQAKCTPCTANPRTVKPEREKVWTVAPE